jgi:hypothetical protein
MKMKKLETRSIVCNKGLNFIFKTIKKKKKTQKLIKSFHMSITHFWYWIFKLNPKPLDTLIVP